MAINVNKIHKQRLSRSDKFAIWITDHVGTMYFFYICCVLALIPLWFTSLLPIVQFVSSAFLQLVLLPLIILSQNLQNRHAELRAEEDYKVNVKAEAEIKEIHRKLDMFVKKDIYTFELMGKNFVSDTTHSHTFHTAKRRRNIKSLRKEVK